MPRNPRRINPILAEFSELWHAHPDMRLGQLVVCLAGKDPFYVEDEKMLSLILDMKGRIQNERTDYGSVRVQG